MSEDLEEINNLKKSLDAFFEKQRKMQKSFSREQEDFVCWQIGEWYLEWKERIISDLEQGTHRLGFAKEQLKTMIFGDGDE